MEHFRRKIDAVRAFYQCDCNILSKFGLTLYDPRRNIACIISSPTFDIDFFKLQLLLYKYRKYVYTLIFNCYCYRRLPPHDIAYSSFVSLHKFFDLVSNNNINF